MLLPMGGIALNGCGSGSSHTPVSPNILVLKQSDVPHEFKPSRGSTHSVSTAQDAKTTHIKASTLMSKGRVNGYEAQYERSGLTGRTTLPSGVLIIDSNVSTWKDASGASWGFSRAAEVVRTSKQFHFVTVSSPRIGNQTLAFKLKFSSSGLTFTSETVAFRQGQYTATATVVGTKNQVSMSDALPYARLLDQRIKKTG